MPKLILLITLCLYFIVSPVFARTTPEDILNSQRSEYAQTVKSYSPAHIQKLNSLSQKIADLNRKITDDLSRNMERQGEILDEYQNRHGGNSTKSIENARYWLTFAHEAVAYQAAKVYVFNLTSEENIKNDVNSTISQLKSDINILSSKVSKSQNIIKQLMPN